MEVLVVQAVCTDYQHPFAKQNVNLRVGNSERGHWVKTEVVAGDFISQFSQDSSDWRCSVVEVKCHQSACLP